MPEMSAVIKALEDEKAKLQALELVRQIRRAGGANTIITLAAYMQIEAHPLIKGGQKI